MKKTIIASAVRSAVGVFGGSLKSVKPLDLIIPVMKESLRRAKIDKEDVDQVMLGSCFSPIDQNIARLALLMMEIPDHVPGHTINCACASASQAIINGVNAIRAGSAEVVIAGGVESMSNAPYIQDSLRWGNRLTHAKSIDLIWSGMQEYPIGGGVGLVAERIAERHQLSREEMDELAVLSHQRAVAAIQSGRFKNEILPIEFSSRKGKTTIVDTDENPREDTNLEKLSKLPPVFKKDGVVTAGNASSMNDGAAAVVLMSEEKAKELGIDSLAEIKDYNVTAIDPHITGLSPVPAIKNVLGTSDISLNDIQLFEINEAFAAYYIATEKELGLDRDITNVNGSGISLGHPVGCSGARILVTLLHEMEKRDLNLGMSSLCAGGGVGTAILVER